jgi:hypothetical protein
MLSACTCNSIFFWPQPELRLTPKQGHIDYENIEISSADGTRLHAWLLKPDSETKTKGRILYLHGNAENISTHIANIHWLPSFGYEVLMLDYRGYGQSEGKACLPGVISDIEAGIAWLKQYQQDRTPLFIIGQSLGASLAAYSVGKHPEWLIQGVVLDAPFRAYSDIAKAKAGELWLTWPLQYPISWMISDRFSAENTISAIAPRPLLMFASINDQVVPFAHSETLFEQAGQPKRLLKTTGPHISTFFDDHNRKRLLAFLAQPDQLNSLGLE